MEFVQKNGRKWKNKKAYDDYCGESLRCYHTYLQLESYADDTGDKSVYETEEHKEITRILKSKEKLSAEELIESNKKINGLLNILIDRLGREKFKFYDDGSVLYIYKKDRQNKK